MAATVMPLRRMTHWPAPVFAATVVYYAADADRQDGSGEPLREGEGDGTKIYVQQRIKEAGATLWPLLRGGGDEEDARPPAVLYVAGSAKNMPAAVRRAVVHVVTEHGGLPPIAAEAFVSTMEKKGRYQCETWA